MHTLEELLAHWLPQQRWFAGKGSPITGVTLEAESVLVPGDPELRHLVVAVRQDSGVDRYQVLLGLRGGEELPDRLRHASLGGYTPGAGGSAGTGPVQVYDALHDAELTSALLAGLAAGADLGGLRLRHIAGVEIDTGHTSLVISGEQSNTSLMFGDAYVLKVFRRLWPGLNPDLELTSVLSERGSPYVARPFGWIEGSVAGTPTTCALLQQFLVSATDGWLLAATSVRDLYSTPDLPPGQAGGDFAGEAARLGAATAAVHRKLAEALPTGTVGDAELAELADSMNQRLTRAAASVPGLAPYTDGLRAAFKALTELDEPMPVQRVHGDYHLGQVVRTDAGWVLLDFEGEPAKPVPERTQLSNPLRDVAGMLRSFDYAARYQLVGHPYAEELAAPAREWAQHNRTAFCAGYAAAGGTDPMAHQAVLRAFEFDKAVYEVMYEAHNRPSWLGIPLSSIAALVG
ncbi:maltokinase N-terminal cap-like domain-containing protein [Allonocardiopsis opalescens]|uniref:Maltokinase n=1 Tax=Allonocardiopsis opalescens TaxID=1144618 RepID=A0A2T0QDX3_9ACTN|nr:phosphotransferase [Allonocardiopsis opalescens]PRY02108.1 maltokinase [Allonocardiopsis opalescens]